VASLPGPRGGDFSHDAYRFVEFAAACGFSVWQVLPLGPTDATGSPYLSASAHAGNPHFVSLDWLVDRGWLDRAEVDAPTASDWTGRRRALLELAFTGFQRDASAAWRSKHERFLRMQAHWLDDFALFAAIADEEEGRSWLEWPAPLRDRTADGLERARATHAASIAQTGFEQWLFFTQWSELRTYAHRHGLYLFGDLPIFVGHQSADVWAHRDLFQLDAHGEPLKVAGVPPDYFAVDGQRWGNPLYDWSRHRASGFAWWIARLRTQMALFDLVRIDHFRGLSACWEIPVSAASARDGAWAPAPGAELLEAARNALGRLPLVAEDLGVITPAVDALRERFGLPGMRVLQFGFDGSPHNVHLPQNFEPLTVAYSGTHDNPPTREWLEQLDAHTRGLVATLFGRVEEPPPWPVLHATLSSVARLAIVPMQDLLALGAGHRMNTPGTSEGNWRWRFGWDQVPADLARHVRDLNWRYGRS
ncbi:MAG TPA: 4-alpha-glucanotransferase, partial [Nevskiaceae bacterium]|nr:4-alpha-glucanotransferase [Nevskiaceae bacterium]